MSKPLRQAIDIATVAVLLLVAGGALLHLAARHSSVSAASLAAVPLIDQNNATRSLDDWRGQLVVLDFIYTGCGDTCPIKTAQLAALQASLDPALRQHVHLVSVSVDPEHDDPAALKSYAVRAGADLTGWTFLTGDLSKIARFVAAFDPMVVGDADSPSHITTVRLLAPDGHVIERYIGEPVDDHRLERDLVAFASSVIPAIH